MEEILLPDTHAHLDDAEFADDLEEVLGRARDAGVGPILAVGSDLQTSLRAVDIAHMYDNVYAAVGVHPHEAARFDEEREGVCALLDDEKVIAVGEIGLDYHRDRAPREMQRAAFREQLRWARDRNLPASVHSRESSEDVLAELQRAGAVTILHCFSGDGSVATAALDLGCYISFAGNLTFPRAAALREVAARVPPDRLLLESDAPVLAPQGRRGKRNEPSYVVMTAETLANEQDVSLDQLSRAVSANARDVLRWSAS